MSGDKTGENIRVSTGTGLKLNWSIACVEYLTCTVIYYLHFRSPEGRGYGLF